MRDLHHPDSIKTSAPSLVGVIDRPRLLDALGKLRSPAKWLQAPSGTGKSTLAASYAQSQAKPFAWYRFDERDNDPSFFYEHLAEAISGQLSFTKPLPTFTADDHARQQDFARYYFGELVAQIDRSALIVFDDTARLNASSILSSLTVLICAASTRTELLFVSESVAPTEFFDVIASRRLELLNDADLHFNISECKAMSTALRVDNAQCEDIAALTGGHAGALVLACQLLRGTDPESAFAAQTAERIHTHLLSKLVERMPPAQRELLLQTAFVTQLTRPIAAALANIDAVNELDALVQRGLLRQAGTGKGRVYEAHGLVRSGMQTLVRAQLGAIKATELAQRTAVVLVENDQQEAAFELLVQGASSAAALQVLRQLAERYAANGHVDLLMSAIEKLPAAEVQADAWISFWVGQAQLRIDEARSRVWLTHSYEAFEKAADRAGMRLAAASVVIAFGLEHADLRELDTWIQRHREAGGETPVAATEQFEPTLLMAIVCVALIAGHYPEQLSSQSVVQRLQQLLELDGVWLSDDQRVQAGRLLITHARIFRTHIEAPNAIIATRRLIQKGVGGSLHRGRWLIDAAYAHFEAGDSSASFEYLQQARILANESNSTRLQFELGFALANHWMKAQMLPEATQELGRLEHLAEVAPPAQRAEFARMTARLLLLQDRHAEGLRYAEDALRLAIAGFSGANLGRFEVELVYALAANNRLSDALDLIRKCDASPPETGNAIAHCLEFLLTGCTELDLLRIGLRNA
ncbi:MAG TPA: hypothetical protein VM937_12415, partial [Burkholderiaceae bacterium]|nr:hypothetical protein [Burkholderiaceae bacterium]